MLTALTICLGTRLALSSPLKFPRIQTSMVRKKI